MLLELEITSQELRAIQASKFLQLDWSSLAEEQKQMLRELAQASLEIYNDSTL